MPYATINKPSLQFNTKLYTGNNNVTQTISGVGFQPDFTWIKCRSDAEFNHLADAVRGANKFLHSNNTDAERTGSRSSGYNTMAFTADGFSLTNPTATNDELNFGSRTYASWNWKANGSGVANTAGTISSTVSANTTSGFSIVSYTYTSGSVTVGHGLGVAPSMIIVKARSVADNWRVYHKSLGNSAFIPFTTAAQTTGSTAWNSTSPTSSVFSLGSFWGGTDTHIAYCFADVKGFSKFGSYTGNGSTDGTFVYTGFKPAFVMFKNTNAGSTNWTIVDNKRNTFNPETQWLYANASDAEIDPSAPSDFLSNGFKLRTTGSYANTSSQTYIYMAFAEQPLVGTNNIPATAR